MILISISYEFMLHEYSVFRIMSTLYKRLNIYEAPFNIVPFCGFSLVRQRTDIIVGKLLVLPLSETVINKGGLRY